ncbi:MAG TPA: hypothetical protein VLB27_10415 [candidate division Zixibacteria bacterium]|nr:hypothetical protein [candidate division Zixibacteria bacterium]
MEALGITQSQLIEIGLNALGYLAAAGLSLFLYASYLNRKVRRAAADQTTMAPYQTSRNSEGPIGREAVVDERTGGAFIRIRGGDGENSSAQGSPRGADQDSERSAHYARNRSEVIRLARKMIEAGNSVERVADLLPISESEMRLVQLGAGAE